MKADRAARPTEGLLLIAALTLLALVLTLVLTDLKLGGDMRDWLRPDRSLTAVGIVAGFLVLAWQLKRQHQNALAVDAEKARNELRLRIYIDLAEASKAASEKLSALSSLYSGLRMEFQRPRASGGGPPTDERFSFKSLSTEQYSATGTVIALMASMEKWEIALGPDFLRFKETLSKHMGELGERSTEFFAAGALFLPPAPALWPPAPAGFARVDELLKRLWSSAFDLTSDIWDLRIASQNRLLGGLFDWRIPPRKPGSPDIKATVLPEDEGR